MDFLDAIQDKGSKINQVFVNIFLSIFILYRAEQCLFVSLKLKILVTANQFISNLQRILLLALQWFKKTPPPPQKEIRGRTFVFVKSLQFL